MSIIISDRLLANLEEAFPDRMPPPGTTLEKLSRLQGQREVVDYIRSLQEDEDPNDVPTR